MDKNILNFYDLYSPNDSIVYRAILEKKDWMFRKLFIPCDFHALVVDGITTYPDLFGLMDQAMVFQKLTLNPSDFKDHERDTFKITKAFNEKYRIRYAYEKIVPSPEETTFWVEMDFTKLDKDTYNRLVANFYPCIDNIDEMDLFYDPTKDIDLMKYPMYGEKGKWVFVLDAHLLVSDKCFMENCLKKIWYNSHNLDQLKIETLKEIASTNKIPLEDYYG
jgi:hypothetical protein